MRTKVFAGLIVLSSIALVNACGGDDDGPGGGAGGNGSGGEGTGGTSSGGSSAGGSSAGGSSAGGNGSSSGGAGGSGGSDGGAAGSTSGGGGEAGQGGDGASGGTGGEPPVEPVACPSEIDGLADAFAAAVCRKRVECCTDDYDTCLTEVTEAMDAIYPDASAAVEAGTAELDCDMFDTCSAAIHEAECADWPAQTGDLGEIPVNEPACHQMVKPLIPAEDACTYHYECIDGLCVEDACLEYVAENAACDGNNQICDPRTMFCNDGDLCQRRLANGVACTTDAECQSGLCDTDDTGMCVAPGPDMCEYVPSAPATCAITSTASSNAPGGLPWLVALTGLGVVATRRRRTSR